GQDHFGPRERPAIGIADKSAHTAAGWKTLGSDPPRLVRRAAQRTAAELTGGFLVLQRTNAVHKHVLDSHTGLIWIGEGGFIDDRFGIEDGDVGEVVLAQESA